MGGIKGQILNFTGHLNVVIEIVIGLPSVFSLMSTAAGLR